MYCQHLKQLHTAPPSFYLINFLALTAFISFPQPQFRTRNWWKMGKKVTNSHHTHNPWHFFSVFFLWWWKQTPHHLDKPEFYYTSIQLQLAAGWDLEYRKKNTHTHTYTHPLTHTHTHTHTLSHSHTHTHTHTKGNNVLYYMIDDGVSWWHWSDHGLCIISPLLSLYIQQRCYRITIAVNLLIVMLNGDIIEQ